MRRALRVVPRASRCIVTPLRRASSTPANSLEGVPRPRPHRPRHSDIGRTNNAIPMGGAYKLKTGLPLSYSTGMMILSGDGCNHARDKSAKRGMATSMYVPSRPGIADDEEHGALLSFDTVHADHRRAPCPSCRCILWYKHPRWAWLSAGCVHTRLFLAPSVFAPAQVAHTNLIVLVAAAAVRPQTKNWPKNPIVESKSVGFSKSFERNPSKITVCERLTVVNSDGRAAVCPGTGLSRRVVNEVVIQPRRMAENAAVSRGTGAPSRLGGSRVQPHSLRQNATHAGKKGGKTETSTKRWPGPSPSRPRPLVRRRAPPQPWRAWPRPWLPPR